MRKKEITGRKRAEEEVSKLAALVENSSDFIGMATPEGQVLFVNPAGCNLLGLKGNNYARQTRIFDYVMEKDRPVVENEILPAIREKGAWHGEIRFRHFETGATIPMLGDVFLIKEHGTARPLALATISRDISERKQAERALWASEERFRSYFELGLIGIAISAPDKGCLEVNDEICRILGYKRGELLQKTWVELTHPSDLAADILNFDRVIAGEIDGYTLDKRFIRKDGQVVHAIMSAKCLRRPDGSVDYFVGLLLDTTERKRAEERLRRSEANLAEGQRLSQTGSWSWVVSSHELYCSEEVLRIFGLDPPAQFCHETFLQMIHPEDQPRVRQIFEHAVHSGGYYEAEYRIIRPDGSIRHITNLARPYFDPSGTLVEYVGTLMDVTERKQAEEALHKLQAELAHVTRITTLGELTASIAHEINQPLGAIVNNGNACLRLMAERCDSNVKVCECISDIISDALRAAMVINRVRALARRSPPELSSLELEDVVADVLALATHELTERRITAQTEFDADLPRVFGDRVQLQQMFLNLVMNASEAMSDMPEDRRSLLITGSRGSLHGQPAVLVTVVDLGLGFNSEDTERLFEAFYTTRPQGMGMGLRISRSIVEAHGGRLWAKPNDGPGATFSLALPVEDNP
jgi:PAS domain S-box-containing protein